MLRTLYQHPEKGFLGAQTFFNLRGVVTVQYWRSFEDLEKFARDKDDPHLEAWRRFNKTIGSDGSVGIFHETYLVEAGKYEALYGNMPVFGPDTLSDQQVNNLVRYVVYLRNPRDEGGLDLGHLGPLSEGLVAWAVGLLGVLLAARWIGTRD